MSRKRRPVPLRCVIDTNVATTANGANASCSRDCVDASAGALQTVMNAGHVFIDEDRAILGEYGRNLRAGGQPGPGDQFLRWLLTNEYNTTKVTRVALTPKVDPEDFEELPPPPKGVNYDRSDRKFLAVAAAHPDHPPVLQSFDSKWWGWRGALAKADVEIHFLCEDELAAKHVEKMGTK